MAEGGKNDVELLVENVQLSARVQELERLNIELKRQLEEMEEATERLNTEQKRQLEEMKQATEAAQERANNAELELKKYKPKGSSKLEAWRLIVSVGVAFFLLLLAACLPILTSICACARKHEKSVWH